MQTLFNITLVIHIFAGTTSLISGPVSMLTAKGGKAHRTSGKVFFAGMTGVFISALVMASIHFNPFLFMIAVFSYYLAVSGYRSLFRKRVKGPKDVRPLDWIVVSIAGLFHLGLLAYGLMITFGGNSSLFGWLSIVFGAIALNSVKNDLGSFIRPPADKMRWLYQHISGMLGAYIAALTAFSAVNMHFLPGMVQWLWPTAIGTPGITAWIIYYKRKHKQKKVQQL